MHIRFQFLILTFIWAIILQPKGSFAQLNKTIGKCVVTLLTGTAAAESISKTVGATVEHNAAREALRKQGYNITDSAVYSLYFTLNNDVSSMNWADIFSKPDVFAVVSIEGQGQFLIPQIYEEYSGQPMLLNVIAKHAKAGRRIVINVYDDDSWSNRVWNTILQNRISCNIDGRFDALNGLRLAAHAGGTFQVLDRDVSIDAPDYIATAEFTVPLATWGRDWVATGPIVDSNKRTLGHLKFARLWSPDDDPTEAVHDSAQRVAFWSVLSVVLIGICGKFMVSLWRTPKAAS